MHHAVLTSDCNLLSKQAAQRWIQVLAAGSCGMRRPHQAPNSAGQQACMERLESTAQPCVGSCIAQALLAVRSTWQPTCFHADLSPVSGSLLQQSCAAWVTATPHSLIEAGALHGCALHGMHSAAAAPQAASGSLTTVAKAIHQQMLCTMPANRMMQPRVLWTAVQREAHVWELN